LSWGRRTDKITLPGSTPGGEGEGEGEVEGEGELSLGGLFCLFSFPTTCVCQNPHLTSVYFGLTGEYGEL